MFGPTRRNICSYHSSLFADKEQRKYVCVIVRFLFGLYQIKEQILPHTSFKWWARVSNNKHHTTSWKHTCVDSIRNNISLSNQLLWFIEWPSFIRYLFFSSYNLVVWVLELDKIAVIHLLPKLLLVTVLFLLWARAIYGSKNLFSFVQLLICTRK